ncbi:hypothetical protein Bca4012_001248 [Brassica carinata]|uniref:F-box domain-containing protein n=1 Tax=Brassica carinata TaxID=52824 RepID=A0A8X7RXR3_BRACI|nr:hypothetical protein Bca52824_044097 [Brassica carinata]
MTQNKKKVNWSELCPELVQCVFERLSFTNLKRGRSVCSSWRTALRGCVPKRNQIPWLILFPQNDNNNENNNTSCVLFVPEDRDKTYKTRDLGAYFVKSSCVATYGSWLLMLDTLWNLYIINPLTGERIDLPTTDYAQYERPSDIKPQDLVACLWIDDISKDYLVACVMGYPVFTKKGNHSWRRISSRNGEGRYKQMVYEPTSRKLYVRRYYNYPVKVWSFSGDDPQQVSEDNYPPVEYAFWDFLSKDKELYLKEEEFYVKEYVDSRLYIAVSTVSGQVLKVVNVLQKFKRWRFLVYKMHPVELTWEVVDSLGDEALILDMGITVVAKDIPGIKRNSIYFSGLDNGSTNPDYIFVFDLTTHEIEPLPQCVFSSVRFSDARWFFPGLDA